jgi:hypothetical protein
VGIGLRLPPASRRLSLIGLSALLITQGCAVARSAGGQFAAGAVARLQESDSSLVALQRQLVDTGAAFLGAEFDRAVLTPARDTWSEMRRGVRDEADSVAVRFDQMVRSALRGTLPEAIDENADLLDVRMRALARAIAGELTRTLGDGVREELSPALDLAVRDAVRSASDAMEADLKPAAHRIMLDLRDSLEIRIGDVDRAVADSKTVSGLRYALYGAGVSLLIWLLIAGAGHFRRRGRAVGVLIDAIEAGGHPETKQAVHECAQEAGLHSWLNDLVGARTRSRKQRTDSSDS